MITAIQVCRGDAEPAPNEFRIVALFSKGKDRALLASLAERYNWTPHFALSHNQALELLSKRRAPMVLYDREVAGAAWGDAIQQIVSMPHKPYAILLSGVIDEHLTSQVAGCGAHGLLRTPLRDDDVTRAIGRGWSSWRRMGQLRAR